MASGDGLQTLLSIAAGLGLAAACGLRVFVPLLAAGAAARLGYLPLAAGFDWLATTPALIALGTATLLEVGAYYVPWLDHVLDLVATPAAVGAGMLASMSVLTDLPPALRWGIGIIGGGGAAGLIQGATALLRLKSTALTGGLANPVLATFELAGAGLVAIIALMLPLMGLVLVMLIPVLAFRASGRLFFGRRPGRGWGDRPEGA
ncbi:MAG: DUF4126 domain-containing protein [Gemmatimonadota bacterium]|nr:DUF4126 domain-containing protein [Gemmatimonadota bacterium]MDH5282771.1 DUF4126 domain-containing protein [Gemmatimonadota bacterium]